MRTHENISEKLNISTSRASSEKKKSFLCLTCGKACTSRSNLAVHTRRHTGKMTNFCDICGKGYPRSTDLTIHMRFIRFGVRSLVNKRIKIILWHFRKHTGEKPFTCLYCNRGFARSDKLTIHVR